MKLRRRSNGIYTVEWVDENGKRQRRSTGRRDRSEALIEAQRIVSGKRIREDEFYSVSNALDAMWEKKWKYDKSALQKSYEVERVRRYWQETPAAAVSYKLADEWVAKMKKAGLKPSSINSALSTLSRALKEAVAMGYIETMPLLPRLPVNNTKVRWLTKEEEDLLKSKAVLLDQHREKNKKPTQSGAIMIALIDVLIQTGCRLSEVLKARPDDVINHTLVLHATKNNRPRGVPLTPEAEEALMFLFQNERWQRVTEGVIESQSRLASARDWCIKRFTIMRNAAGLKDVTLHILRHTAASRMVQAGVDRYKVQKILGHSSPAVTERYAHLSVEHLRNDIMVLSHGRESISGNVVPFKIKK